MNASTSVVYIISNVNKAVAFEWIAEAFQKEPQGVKLQFVLLNKKKETSLSEALQAMGVEHYWIPLGGKSSYLSVLLKLIRKLRILRPQQVHAHLFEASLLGLLEARIAGVKRRIHTRHHSTYHHDYFPSAVKYDKIINGLSTDVIAISQNVKNVLMQKENLAEKKISLIEHGFPLKQFQELRSDSANAMKSKYGIPGGKKVIGSISRYIQWKGVDYLIDAFAKLLKEDPNYHLVLANASGSHQETIRKKLQQLNAASYTEIEFEEDLFGLYSIFDFFVHVPINREVEAYGQTYVEALAAGVPALFTLSGIACDFVENEKNALVVDYQNSKQIVEGLRRLNSDSELRDALIAQGLKDVQRFSLDQMLDKLRALYLSS